MIPPDKTMNTATDLILNKGEKSLAILATTWQHMPLFFLFFSFNLSKIHSENKKPFRGKMENLFKFIIFTIFDVCFI